MKKFLPLIIFLFLLLFIIIGTYKISNQHNKKFINKPLPEFKLSQLYKQNNYFANYNLKKNQYYLINFFASWCSSCKLEHDILLQLEYIGLDIIGIAWRDFDDKVKEFLTKYDNPYQEVLIDPKNDFGKLLNISGTPESYLIDKNQKIIWHKKGALIQSDADIIKNFLTKD